MNTKITFGNRSQAFFILSAARAAIGPLETIARSQTLLDRIRADGYAAAACNGCYDGVKEPSIIVIDDTPEIPRALDDMLRYARAYGQESILSVDVSSAAQLLFTQGAGSQDLGKWTAVPRAIAEQTNAYTERAGWYYICVKGAE